MADDPSLTVRRPDLGEVLPPERLVLDTGLRTPPGARLIRRRPGARASFAAGPMPERRRALEAAGALVEVIAERDGRPDLVAVDDTPRGARDAMSCWSRPGPAAEWRAAGCRAWWTRSSSTWRRTCSARMPSACSPASRWPRMAGRHEFELAEVRRIGPDCRLTYRQAQAR